MASKVFSALPRYNGFIEPSIATEAGSFSLADELSVDMLNQAYLPSHWWKDDELDYYKELIYAPLEVVVPGDSSTDPSEQSVSYVIRKTAPYGVIQEYDFGVINPYDSVKIKDGAVDGALTGHSGIKPFFWGGGAGNINTVDMFGESDSDLYEITGDGPRLYSSYKGAALGDPNLRFYQSSFPGLNHFDIVTFEVNNKNGRLDQLDISIAIEYRNYFVATPSAEDLKRGLTPPTYLLEEDPIQGHADLVSGLVLTEDRPGGILDNFRPELSEERRLDIFNYAMGNRSNPQLHKELKSFGADYDKNGDPSITGAYGLGFSSLLTGVRDLFGGHGGFFHAYWAPDQDFYSINNDPIDIYGNTERSRSIFQGDDSWLSSNDPTLNWFESAELLTTIDFLERDYMEETFGTSDPPRRIPKSADIHFSATSVQGGVYAFMLPSNQNISYELSISATASNNSPEDPGDLQNTTYKPSVSGMAPNNTPEVLGNAKCSIAGINDCWEDLKSIGVDLLLGNSNYKAAKSIYDFYVASQIAAAAPGESLAMRSYRVLDYIMNNVVGYSKLAAKLSPSIASNLIPILRAGNMLFKGYELFKTADKCIESLYYCDGVQKFADQNLYSVGKNVSIELKRHFKMFENIFLLFDSDILIGMIEESPEVFVKWHSKFSDLTELNPRSTDSFLVTEKEAGVLSSNKFFNTKTLRSEIRSFLDRWNDLILSGDSEVARKRLKGPSFNQISSALNGAIDEAKTFLPGFDYSKIFVESLRATDEIIGMELAGSIVAVDENQDVLVHSDSSDATTATQIPTSSSSIPSPNSPIFGIEPQETVKTVGLQTLLAIGSLQIDQVVVGTAVRDVITGSDKGEALSGGQGKDKMTGGGGPDAFLFETPGEFGKKKADTITDFRPEESDKIAIAKETFSEVSRIKLDTATGKQDVRSAASTNKNFIYDDKSGILYFNENGRKAGFGNGGEFAQLLGAPDISKGDLVLL